MALSNSLCKVVRDPGQLARMELRDVSSSVSCLVVPRSKASHASSKPDALAPQDVLCRLTSRDIPHASRLSPPHLPRGLHS